MVGKVTDMPEVVRGRLRLCFQIVVTGTREVSRPGRRLGGANDPVDAFLDYLNVSDVCGCLGCKLLDPLYVFPVRELLEDGYGWH